MADLSFYDGNRAVTGAILVMVSFSILCVTKVIRYHRDPLRIIPGPFWARYTRLWYLLEMLNCHSRDTIARLHEKFGEIGYFLSSLSIKVSLTDCQVPLCGLDQTSSVFPTWMSQERCTVLARCLRRSVVAILLNAELIPIAHSLTSMFP